MSPLIIKLSEKPLLSWENKLQKHFNSDHLIVKAPYNYLLKLILTIGIPSACWVHVILFLGVFIKFLFRQNILKFFEIFIKLLGNLASLIRSYASLYHQTAITSTSSDWCPSIQSWSLLADRFNPLICQWSIIDHEIRWDQRSLFEWWERNIYLERERERSPDKIIIYREKPGM